MPRRKTILSNQFPYHVYVRSNNREHFEIDLPKVWEICSDMNFYISVLYNVHIHHFVLMPNHAHFILTTPEANLDDAMRYWMTEVSRSINKIANRINHLFGGPYKACLVTDDTYFKTVEAYVINNPVAARLVDRPEQYPYSTWTAQTGNGFVRFPLWNQLSEKELSAPYEKICDPVLVKAALKHSKLKKVTIDRVRRKKI